MKRRSFLYSTTTLTALSPFFQTLHLLKEDIITRFIIFNDQQISNILNRQQKDQKHPFHGGYADRYEIYHPISAAGYAVQLICGFVSKESSYYKSKRIQQALNLGLDFLLRVQHPNGNIDLLTTNFNSPPDTAFAVEPLGQAIQLLQMKMPDQLPAFQQKAKQFLIGAGNAMSVGGIHTPNHRWVICRALARIHKLYPNRKYLNRINQWLAEGIDIDPDGQYTEKSSGGYSPLVNECFITVARLLGKTHLYEAVRKNLDMTLYFVHANGEVVTEASKRQDQYRIGNMSSYYFGYRYMAILDQNPVYAAMAVKIEKQVGLKGLYGNLGHFLEESTLVNPLPKGGLLPQNYVRHFPFSKMARIRRESVDATILGDNTTFFTFFKGNTALQAIRLASAFFGKGQFQSTSLKIENNVYILSQDLIGPYYQPHHEENIDPDGDWHKMPRKYRPQSEIQKLKSIIRISENKGSFTLHFDISGTNHVPLAIELAFRPGGQFSGTQPIPGLDQVYILEKGYGRYTHEGESIKFGPGHKEHGWTQLRGAKPKLNGESVYLTAYTPFNFTLKIK